MQKNTQKHLTKEAYNKAMKKGSYFKGMMQQKIIT